MFDFSEVGGGQLLYIRVIDLYRKCICSLNTTYLFEDDQTQGTLHLG